MNKFDTLADRIRSEAEQASRPGQMERLEGMAAEVEALRVWENPYEIRANTLREVEEAIIQAAPPINSELLYDGREDPTAAAYVEGFKDAWQVVSNLHTSLAASSEGSAS